MKNILIIEDDSFKADSLRDFISCKLSSPLIHFASSLVEAIDSINQNEYNLILIDMAIPSHPTISGEGTPMSLLTGGLDVLLELNFLERHDPCVIITQYPEIEISGQFFPVREAGREIKDQLDCDVLDCIEYTEGSEQWKKALSKTLGKL